jgi:hypothetical protein
LLSFSLTALIQPYFGVAEFQPDLALLSFILIALLSVRLMAFLSFSLMALRSVSLMAQLSFSLIWHC